METITKAYVQRTSGRPTTAPMNVAAEGLEQIGCEIQWFDESEADELDLSPSTLVVSYIEIYRKAVHKITGRAPAVLNYPQQLNQYLGRKIEIRNLREVQNNVELWPVFVKPAEDIKTFSGRLVKTERDIVATATLPSDYKVWTSEPVSFLSEYRCFVLRGEILGCRHYRGNPLVWPAPDKIKSMVHDWTDSPVAYCLDVGCALDGRTLLIEINDAHSAGTYGLHPIPYARFLEARWCELTGAKPIP